MQRMTRSRLETKSFRGFFVSAAVSVEVAAAAAADVAVLLGASAAPPLPPPPDRRRSSPSRRGDYSPEKPLQLRPRSPGKEAGRRSSTTGAFRLMRSGHTESL